MITNVVDSFLERDLPVTSNRSNQRKFLLHKEIVKKLSSGNNFFVFEYTIRSNIDSMRSETSNPIVLRWLDRWEQSLNEGLVSISDLSLQTWDSECGDDGSDLRQMSPFMGILSDDERMRVFNLAI